MKKILASSMAVAIAAAFSFLQMAACKKDPVIPQETCSVSGTYSGNNIASTGASSSITYQFQENNFVRGSILKDGAFVTFGGYRNTCDSVILSVYYTENSSYYLLEGAFSNNRMTISGTFKNLTNVSDFGTFSMSK